MRLKTNAVPEVKLTRKDGTIIKKGDAPAYIEDATFNFLAAAYANLTAENGDKAVVKIGEGKNASTILFAHDEDSNQDVLFLDGYFVTKVSVEKDEITFWRTLKSSYKSFISKHKKLSRDEKQKLYTGIVFRQNHTDMPKGLPEFLVKSWKQKPNLNSLRSALLGKYSKGQAREYYDLIKAHIKILNNIK